MRTGPYIGHQVVQVFHTGARAGGSAEEEIDRKGDHRRRLGPRQSLDFSLVPCSGPRWQWW